MLNIPDDELEEESDEDESEVGEQDNNIFKKKHEYKSKIGIK
jgi:hypothetical protein